MKISLLRRLALMVEDGAFSHKIDYVTFKKKLNLKLKGHPNRVTRNLGTWELWNLGTWELGNLGTRNLSGHKKKSPNRSGQQKSPNLSGQKKSPNLSGQKKITQPLGTKKHPSSWDKINH